MTMGGGRGSWADRGWGVCAAPWAGGGTRDVHVGAERDVFGVERFAGQETGGLEWDCVDWQEVGSRSSRV